MLQAFDSYFGSARNGVCAFSFEPNPKHQPRLREMEEVYKILGWRYYHFNAAVSNRNATLSLLRRNNNSFDFAAVLVKDSSRFKNISPATFNTVQVTVIDFIEFIERHIINRRIHSPNGKGKVIVKMDIEGEEYDLLPALISSGLLCGSVDVIMVEFHVRQAKRFLGPTYYNATKEDIFALMLSMKRAIEAPECGVHFQKLDDETFQFDSFANNPLPTTSSILPPKCFERTNKAKGNGAIGIDCLLTKPQAGMSDAEYVNLVMGFVHTSPASGAG
jgi:FkbM family methyltransferase